MRRKRWGDDGSATVCTVFAAAALCAVFLALMGLGQAVTARHRAGGAADLAALAAADRAVQGPTAACTAAGRVAAAQHTRLVRCAVSGPVADVSVEAGSEPFTTQSRARAGPAAQGASPARTEAQRASPARKEAQGASPPGTPPQEMPPARPGGTRAVPGPYGAAGGPLPARWAYASAAARTTAQARPTPLGRHANHPLPAGQHGRPHTCTLTDLFPLPQREGTDRRAKSVGLSPHPTSTQPAAGGTSHAL
ncbi:Rv3654c family TadE-like protein [Streptomyces sp. NPDC001739]